jgi:hypothetical protein
MRREETKPNELCSTCGDATRTRRTKSGTGRYTVLMRTPAWATEQIEHSWLGSLELSVCTWTAWTMPVKATSRIHSKDRARIDVSLRDLYPNAIKQNAPSANAILDIPRVSRTMLYFADKLPGTKVIDGTVPAGAWFGRG